MINIFIYGLDQFVVGDLSRDITSNIAKIYEVEEDAIFFFAPQNMVFHRGVEQTSWNVFVYVSAPKKVAVLEKDADKIIATTIMNSKVGIHVYTNFSYYSEDNYHLHLNPDYPLFITDENQISITEEDNSGEEGEEDDEIFTGDIFAKTHKH